VISRLPRIHSVQTTAVAPLHRAWQRLGQRDIGEAVAHRADFMWPWEVPGPSIASGILDDETYDWIAVLRGMRNTGGFPVLVTEEELMQAKQLAGDRVSATGAAGLAALLQLRVSGESQMVLFTGAA
jgi:threonine synthase